MKIKEYKSLYPVYYWITATKDYQMIADTFDVYENLRDQLTDKNRGDLVKYLSSEGKYAVASTHCATRKSDGATGVLLIIHFPNEFTCSYVAHEAVHAADYIFESIGAPGMDFERNEPYAYLTGWCAQCTTEFLDELVFEEIENNDKAFPYSELESLTNMQAFNSRLQSKSTRRIFTYVITSKETNREELYFDTIQHLLYYFPETYSKIFKEAKGHYFDIENIFHDEYGICRKYFLADDAEIAANGNMYEVILNRITEISDEVDSRIKDKLTN